MVTADEIYSCIERYSRIYIFSHVHPDGDAAGAVGGLAELIRHKFPDKKVYCIGEEHKLLSDLVPMDSVAEKSLHGALAIVLDTANIERISDDRWSTASFAIKIDHHPLHDAFGDIVWVDTEYASCCEMITELLVEWGGSTTATGAELLMHGIVTDTGRFRYPSVTSRTLNRAAHLLEKGADLQRIYDRLYAESVKEIRFKGFILSNFETTGRLVAHMSFTEDLLRSHGVKPSAALKNINLLSTATGIRVWAFFVEFKGRIRVELRSDGPPVNTVAAAYGGGGHALAAGATIDDWETAKKMVDDLYEAAEMAAATTTRRP